MKDFIVIFGPVLLVIILIGFGAYYGDSKSCHAKAEMMNARSNYSGLTGCMIEKNGEWWPIDSFYMKGLR